uniref:Uncharacterized protein n=1 Tax=uncultured crenarchaeote TaxID=29281 RepID=H5SGD2_9CREN|nr:hypothetical protein HGMM_F25A04C04 [uncultured crenarchaeote]
MKAVREEGDWLPVYLSIPSRGIRGDIGVDGYLDIIVNFQFPLAGSDVVISESEVYELFSTFNSLSRDQCEG